MRIPVHQSDSRALSINLTPMIDMVFLLIIFFIVSSSMVQQEAGIPVDLPSATTGHVPEEDLAKKIIITILGENAIYVGTQQITQEQLRDYLVSERKQTKKPIKVRIRADRMTPYAIVEPTMITCIEAGIPNVSFSVLRKNTL